MIQSKSDIPEVCCFRCEEYNPILNEWRGYCDIFDKEVTPFHGTRCTAFVRLNPEPPAVDKWKKDPTQ